MTVLAGLGPRPTNGTYNAVVYQGPLATGENLFSLQDARNLIRYGGLRPATDYIQVDPALSYGLVEYLRILEIWKRTHA